MKQMTQMKIIVLQTDQSNKMSYCIIKYLSAYLFEHVVSINKKSFIA